MTQPCAAPVALFAYMRPDHLERTVAALRRNPLAAQTTLIVFADAARSPAHQAGVDQVRRLVDGIEGFAQVRRVYRERNFGLARSIIDGVGRVLVDHERVIVLEDDLEVSEHFLDYMNQALELYRDNDQVASIHGYSYPVPGTMPETYFLRGADCWGWATWRRAWQHFDPDGQSLLEQLEQRRLQYAFDLQGSYPFTRMLRHQIAGRNDSWAIRWHASTFLKDMLTLYPGRSLVQNIGHDGSGTHSAQVTDFDTALATQRVVVERIALAESSEAVDRIATYFRKQRWLPRRLVKFAAQWLQRRFKG